MPNEKMSDRVRALFSANIITFVLTACFFTSMTAQADAQDNKTVTAVMHSGLRLLDPIVTTAYITRNHGYMIYDVLLAQDENFQVRPQMAEFEVSEDRLTYTFTLREGLLFHDGQPVTATDVVASLQRWGRRDTGGQMIFDVTESLEASDDRTVVWVLREPFGPMLDTLSKQSNLPTFIMPARIAQTPVDEAITEYIGSGPFVFVEEEFQPGVSVTYSRFEDYLPREEPASWMAGGKVVNVDRVLWVTMPDSQTAMNALTSGEIDYLEEVQVDLLPILQADPDVVVEVRDPLGYQNLGRMNFKHPPFDNQQIRQAALKAISQEPVLVTMVGSPNYYSLCGAIFGCNTPLASEVGSETLTSDGDREGARALLEEAGYDGKPIVLLHPTDVVALATMPVVAAQQLREVGFNVDLQPMDWQTLVTRRANRGPVEQGGWNLFFSRWQTVDITTPINNLSISGRGDEGYWGWALDEEVEALRAEYVAADTFEKQKEVAQRIQEHVLETVLYIPLGEVLNTQARRANIDNMIASPVPVFWHLTKN